MRIDAPLFTLDTRRAPPPERATSASFRDVLHEQPVKERDPLASSINAEETGVDAEPTAQELSAREETDEGAADEMDAQADGGAQGEEAADEEVAEKEAAFAVESELAGFDGVVAEAISSEPIDAAVRVDSTVESSAVMGTSSPVTPLELVSNTVTVTPSGAAQPVVGSGDPAVASDWVQAFEAQPIAEQAAAQSDSATDDAATKLGVSGGRIAVPEAMRLVRPVAIASIDLSQPQATQNLQEAVTFQIRASQSPSGAKQLSLTLNPEGLGRLRILAQTEGETVRVFLKVEQGDAARLLERMMPQIEAQLAASMAMPVEFDVIQEERLGAEGDDLYEADTEDQPGQDHQEPAGDDGLVEQWTQSLEEPMLDLGQTLHVVA